MNEQELRALVREAVERHLGRPPEKRFREPSEKRSPAPFSEYPEKGAGLLFSHPSHILLKVVPGSEAEDGMCVIEPSVRCTHCGFCQSYGH
jgi:hypothetical protein